MALTEPFLDRWMERGGKFFRTLARNAVIRSELLARGLTDEELTEGWSLYARVHGIGAESAQKPTTQRPAAQKPAAAETSAAEAMNEIDAWDAPAYKTAKAVLHVRYPQVEAFLFANLEASTGPAAVTGVERFLTRIAALRKGKAKGVDPRAGRAAVELLAKRKVIDEEREAKLRDLIETVRLGARPQEIVAVRPRDPKRKEAAQAFIGWLREWREVARMALSRRSHLISLGLARRRQANKHARDGDGTEPKPEAKRT